MKKVLIINEGFSNNLGDQAINQAMISFFNNKGFKTSFMYLSNPSINIKPDYLYLTKKPILSKKKTLIKKLKSYLVFFYWIFSFNKIIKKTLLNDHFDLIIIGGGQLVISSGTFSLSGFSISIFWFSYLIKKYTKAKLYLIAVGTSKKFNFFETYLYSKSLKRMDTIWARDLFSQEIMKKIFKIKALLIPDIAFYKKREQNLIHIKKEHFALIGVTSYNEVFARYNNVMNFSKKKYYNNLYAVIKRYKAENCEVKLFYTTITDANECVSFSDFLIKKYQLKIEILKVNNIDDLQNFFDNAKYVYSGRMHALILAMKSKCLVEAYPISKKLNSFDKEYIKRQRSVEELNLEIINQLNNIV